MNYFEQLEKYDERGLNKYKLKSIEDVEAIYGSDKVFIQK